MVGQTVVPFKEKPSAIHCADDGVPDVLVVVEQEPPQDVDGQDPQSALALDVHDGEDGLVQDGVAHVLGGLCVGGDLGQDVVHGLGGVGVVAAEDAQQPEDFDLGRKS